MPNKGSSIENIDEQIRKLEGDDSTSLEKVKDEEATKIFENVDDGDTKVFDVNKVDDKSYDVVEDTKVNEVIEILDVPDDVKNEAEGVKDVALSDDTVITEKRSSSKNSMLVIVLLLFFLLLIGLIVGGLLYVKFSDGDSGNDVVIEEELTEEEKKQIINQYGVFLEKVLGNYLLQQNTLLEYEEAIKLVDIEDNVVCKAYSIYSDGKVYLNKCSINGVLTEYSYGEKQVEESGENILNVYVDNNTGKATLIKPANADDYKKYVVHCGSSYFMPVLLNESLDYVFFYDSEENVQMMNYKTDEKILANVNYQEVLPIKLEDNVYDATYIAVRISGFWGIYKISSGEQVISPMYSNFVPSLEGGVGPVNQINAIGPNLIVAWDGKNYGVINYTTNKIVIPFEYSYMFKSDNYIWAKDHKDSDFIYDMIGNKYLTDEYDQVYGIVNGDYVLIKNAENVKIVQINGKILYNYGIIKNMGDLFDSKIRDNTVIFQFYDTNTTGKCIEIIYDISKVNGTYSSGICGGF